VREPRTPPGGATRGPKREGPATQGSGGRFARGRRARRSSAPPSRRLFAFTWVESERGRASALPPAYARHNGFALAARSPESAGRPARDDRCREEERACRKDHEAQVNRDQDDPDRDQESQGRGQADQAQDQGPRVRDDPAQAARSREHFSLTRPRNSASSGDGTRPAARSCGPWVGRAMVGRGTRSSCAQRGGERRARVPETSLVLP
jgi:hypothetical protein